jgi:hypothetical protein
MQFYLFYYVIAQDPKHVAVWILPKVVFNGYFFIPYW